MATVQKRKPEGIRDTIAGGVARGARAYYDLAKSRYREALESQDASTKVEFPNTGYYLPVITPSPAMLWRSLKTFSGYWMKRRSCFPPSLQLSYGFRTWVRPWTVEWPLGGWRRSLKP